jgi:predicted phosphodiesterase
MEKMKIAYASDIHLDFWISTIDVKKPKFKDNLYDFVDRVLRPDLNDADVLVLAGDLGHYNQQTFELLKLLKKEYYKRILIVYGNHELYLLSDKDKHKYDWDSMNRIEEIKDFCAEHEGIDLLDGNTITIDGVVFGGACMSWDGSYAKKYYPKKADPGILIDIFNRDMNDAHYMFADGRDHITYKYAYGGKHFEASFKPLSFFDEQRAKLDSIQSCDIMVSHYAPFVSSVLPPEFEDIDTTFYVFDGSEDIKRTGCKIWVAGHQHMVYDEMYKGCRMVCSPIGYPKENIPTNIKVIEYEKE